jgi:hypothetical protein
MVTGGSYAGRSRRYDVRGSEGVTDQGGSAMASDYMRCLDGMLVMDGVYGVTYNVDTVESIDGNLDSMRARPDHPDIDRLLDARRHVSVLNFIWPPVEES